MILKICLLPLLAGHETPKGGLAERLPRGLDTQAGSGGTYLSGDENQRIALARAILKDATIIVLDEATAFADAENEHQIQWWICRWPPLNGRCVFKGIKS